MSDLFAGLDDRGPVVDRAHRRGLLQRPITGSASAPPVPVGAASAQIRLPWRDDQTAVDRLVDRLRADMPRESRPELAAEPAADLLRGPPLAELRRDDVPQLGVL